MKAPVNGYMVNEGPVGGYVVNEGACEWVHGK